MATRFSRRWLSSSLPGEARLWLTRAALSTRRAKKQFPISSIQSGALNDTVVGRGTKMSDGVVIGHGTRIGEGCLIVSQVGIAGSTTVGKYCVLAGQVGISGHLKIGDRVTIGAQSGVASDVESGATIFGSPAFELKPALAAYASIKLLPELRRTLKKLEQRVAELEGRDRSRKGS